MPNRVALAFMIAGMTRNFGLVQALGKERIVRLRAQADEERLAAAQAKRERRAAKARARQARVLAQVSGAATAGG